MKYKPNILFKKVIENIKKKIKLSVEEIIKVLLITTICLFAIGIIKPSIIFPKYTGLHGGYKPITYLQYFLFVSIKEGAFVLVWFLFFPSISYYLGKKNFPRFKFPMLIVGLLLVIGIYNWIPRRSLVAGTRKLYTLYDLGFQECSDKIYFFYSPDCGTSRNVMPTVKKLETTFGLGVKWRCVGNKTYCIEKYGIEAFHLAKNEKNFYGIKTAPSFIFKCKYLLRGVKKNETTLENAVCTLYDLSEICRDFEKLTIYK